MANTPACAYIISHLSDLKFRDILQEFLTMPDRLSVEVDDKGKTFVDTPSPVYAGKLAVQDGMFRRVVHYKRIPNTRRYEVELVDTGIAMVEGQPLIRPTDPCTISAGDIANYPEGKPMETTIGRVIVNYLLFADPFGAAIPYMNARLPGGKIERVLTDAVVQKRVTVDQFYHYVQNLNYLGHSPEFVAPNLTPKALVTDPNVKQRKQELIAKLKDRLEAGDATAMAAIESELIQMDKNWLKDDPSMKFMLKGKYFHNVRKKLLLTHGSVESFSDQGQYAYVPNSLEEGWVQSAFPVIANEIRSGSYSRARETAKGGEESKFLLRVFQNTRILEEDCKSKTGLTVNIDRSNVGEYMYRNFFDSGKLNQVSDDNKESLIGRSVTFRSPMYCHTDGGYCYTCMGQLFKNLGVQVLASAVNEIGSAMLASALAKVHKSGVSVMELGDLNDYLVK